MTATTVSPSITLPCHLSIMSSRKPISHGVLTNSGRPRISPDTRTVFEIAKDHRLKTAAFYSWEQLRNLNAPGVLDQSVMINTLEIENGDLLIGEVAGDHILRFMPDLSFIYLEGADMAGHAHGWMSPEYLQALSVADQSIGTLVDRLAKQYCWNVVVTSDHGGNGTHHQVDEPEVMTVPFIGCGPNFKAGHSIKSSLSVLDIAPTLTAVHGITPHWSWEGHVVHEILAET
jgi:predicted AlkP superfamily pyrophosphatase or phosphodiesterase